MHGCLVLVCALNYFELSLVDACGWSDSRVDLEFENSSLLLFQWFPLGILLKGRHRMMDAKEVRLHFPIRCCFGRVV